MRMEMCIRDSVGRYKFNKKLSFKSRLSGHILADDVVDTQGNVIAQAGDKLDRETAQAIQDAAAVSYTHLTATSNPLKMQKHWKILNRSAL